MADNITILDSTGTTITMATTDAAGVHSPKHIVTSVISGAIASGAIASGAVASGAIASGAIASGALASGSISSGAIASGAIASGAIAAGAIAAGATSIADNEDAASASGDRGVKILAVQLATPADSAGTDGDYSFLQMSGGRLWVDASGKTLTVASHAVTNAGVFAVQVDGTALTRLTDIETNTDSCAVVGNGAASTAQRVTLANDSTGVLATLTTLTGSGIAHDGVDSGNPHKIGAKAVTSLSGVTLVASADRTDLYAGLDGVQITRPHTNLEDIVSGVAAVTDGSSTSVIAAQGSGIKTYITSVIIANSSSSNVTVDLRDGTAGSVKATFPAPANGGAVFTLDVPLPFSANTAVAADPSAAASTITTTLVGFKSKV